MDAPETTMTPTDTGMGLPDDTEDEQELRTMSKDQVIALYIRAVREWNECQVMRDEYSEALLSLMALTKDYNDGTAETRGTNGIMGYLAHPELGNGITGPWFKFARERFEQTVQQPRALSNNVTSSTLTQETLDQESVPDIHERTVLSEAREAAKRHFENIGRSETFLLTEAYINDAHPNMSRQHRYVISRNLARALHIFDTEWRACVNHYDLNGSIPASVWAWWLSDKSSRVSARLGDNSVWVPMTVPWELNTNAFAPAATENGLGKYDIDGMPDEPRWNVTDYPK